MPTPMREEPRTEKGTEYASLRVGVGTLGRLPGAGSVGEGRWEMNPGEGKGDSVSQKPPGKRVGQSPRDSLLSDDVIPWQRCAGHSGHLHVVGDLREVQTQVHAVDGHSSPSLRWSRHCQNLREGNGVSLAAVPSLPTRKAEGLWTPGIRVNSVLSIF